MFRLIIAFCLSGYSLLSQATETTTNTYQNDNVITPSAQQQYPAASTPLTTADLNQHTKWSAPDIGLTLGVSTLGLSGHLSTPLVNKALNLRIGMNYLRWNYHGDKRDVNFGFTARLESYDVLFDFFPFLGDFRLTGGVVFNKNRLSGMAKPTINNSYIINGHHYNYDDVGQIQAKASFPKASPYVGFGYGNSVDKDVKFSVTTDFGWLLNNSPTVTIGSTQSCTLTTAQCEQLDSDMDALNKDINKPLKRLKWYPMLRIAIGYRF